MIISILMLLVSYIVDVHPEPSFFHMDDVLVLPAMTLCNDHWQHS